MDRTIRSWDRVAYTPGHERFSGTTGPVGDPYFNCSGGVPVRVVVWPEGAPDPSTVPHAGEQVTWRHRDTVYNVVNGIPKWDSYRNVWQLWVKNVTSGESQHPAVGGIRVYEDPPRTYTEAEIRAAFENNSDRYYVDAIIKALREGS